METPKTSFIPKKMYVNTGGPRRSSTVSIFNIVGIIIFVTTLVISGGVFFYHKVLVSSMEKLDTDLIEEKNSFEPDTVEEAVRLSQRIESVKGILSNHIVVHPIFELLSEKTLKSIQFTNFSYTFPKGSDEVSMTMNGIAGNFEAIALQSDIFGSDKNINDPIFSNLSPDKSGNVTFSFSAKLPVEFVLFENNFEEN